MKKFQTIAPTVLFCILLVIVIVCIMAVMRQSGVNDADYFSITDGWTATVDGTVYTDVNMEELHFASQGKGSVVKFETIMPDCDIRNPVLYLYSIHSAVEVMLNDELIYEYGTERLAQNKLLGYGKQYIELPDDYAGKQLAITLYVAENDAFTSFDTPQICNGNNVIRDMVIINKIPLTLSLFLITFGMCIVFVSVFFAVKNKQFNKLMCVGLFSAGIGIWSLCSYDLIMLFTYDLKIKAYLEYTMLYICPLPVVLYFKDDMAKRKKWVQVIYQLLVAGIIAFIGTSIVLQLTNIAHFPALLKIMHGMLVADFAFLLAYFANDLIRRQLERKALMIGILIMIAVGLLDILRFNLQKYIPAFIRGHYTSMLCLGAFVFVMSQIVDFAMEIRRILYTSAQKEALERIAYTDALTGISNRRKCEEDFDELDKKNNYGILAFDLNNLKKMNDNNGHDKGDLLIKTFADTLSRAFGEQGAVGRMGGDEFMVLFPDMSEIDLDSLLACFENEVRRVNEKMPELMNMSAAYGYCGHAEHPESDAREIYRMADAKMYEQKIAMKCARG